MCKAAVKRQLPAAPHCIMHAPVVVSMPEKRTGTPGGFLKPTSCTFIGIHYVLLMRSISYRIGYASCIVRSSGSRTEMACPQSCIVCEYMQKQNNEA